jgi:hypothetical protein
MKKRNTLSQVTPMSRNRIGSYYSFRPSTYSTGLQPVQPYTAQWLEGGEYGFAWPWEWAAEKVEGIKDTVHEAVAPESFYEDQYKELLAEQEKEEKRTRSILMVVGGVALGLGAAYAYKKYVKGGRR